MKLSSGGPWRRHGPISIPYLLSKLANIPSGPFRDLSRPRPLGVRRMRDRERANTGKRDQRRIRYCIVCRKQVEQSRTGWQEEMMHRRDILEPARARRGHAKTSQDVLASGCRGGNRTDKPPLPNPSFPYGKKKEKTLLIKDIWHQGCEKSDASNVRFESHSASSSCCCAFSSNFWVAMAEQLCSNPWGTALFKAKFGTTPKNEPKTTKIGGWGHLVQINPPPGSLCFPMIMKDPPGVAVDGSRRCGCSGCYQALGPPNCQTMHDIYDIC